MCYSTYHFIQDGSPPQIHSWHLITSNGEMKTNTPDLLLPEQNTRVFN